MDRAVSLRVTTLLLAPGILAGCNDAGETASRAAAANAQANQAETNSANQAEPALCNDCPPPGYEGPPLG